MGSARIRFLFVCLLLAGCDSRRIDGADAGRDAAMAASSGGLVSLTQLDQSTGNHILFGTFLERPLDALLRGELPGCAVAAESGSCRAVLCGSGAATPSSNAGTLVASVGGVEVASATLSGATYGAVQPGTVFSSGDTIEISAGGGVVPAFRASVIGPDAPITSLPSTFSRSNDLTLTWPSALAAQELQLAVLPTAAGGALISCPVPASSGSVTISRELAGMLSIGSTLLTLSAYNATRARAGTYDVHVAAARGVSINATIVE